MKVYCFISSFGTWVYSIVVLGCLPHYYKFKNNNNNNLKVNGKKGMETKSVALIYTANDGIEYWVHVAWSTLTANRIQSIQLHRTLIIIKLSQLTPSVRIAGCFIKFYVVFFLHFYFQCPSAFTTHTHATCIEYKVLMQVCRAVRKPSYNVPSLWSILRPYWSI